MSGRSLKVFTGSANPALAQEVADSLDVPLGEMELARHADGEVHITINESVRGADAFIIQPTAPPVNEHLIELLVIIDAMRRASAARITAVIPYFGYARQDRKTRPREPISSKLVANLLTAAGANRILAVDLHAGQIWGFFDIPLDHLPSRMLLAEDLQRHNPENLIIVSPDIGGTQRAREFAALVRAPIAIIDKRRDKPNQVKEIVHVIGKVYKRRAVIVDDIADTAGTLTMAVQALLRRGVTEVSAYITHAVLSGPALARITQSPLRELVVTNTVALAPEKHIEKIRVLSVAPLLGEAVRRIHEDRSVSGLFEVSPQPQPV